MQPKDLVQKGTVTSTPIQVVPIVPVGFYPISLFAKVAMSTGTTPGKLQVNGAPADAEPLDRETARRLRRAQGR
jgi:hypothetical protein